MPGDSQRAAALPNGEVTSDNVAFDDDQLCGSSKPNSRSRERCRRRRPWCPGVEGVPGMVKVTLTGNGNAVLVDVREVEGAGELSASCRT